MSTPTVSVFNTLLSQSISHQLAVLSKSAYPSVCKHRRTQLRCLSTSPKRFSPRPTNATKAAIQDSSREGGRLGHQQLSFPCLEKLEQRSKALIENGPEPAYSKITAGSVEIYHSKEPVFLDYGGYLPEYQIAYESWGKLNADRSNAILIHTGLSASSHAKSTLKNPKKGWWENFIGPGKYLDTDKYFIICTNVIGGCFGSTGPSSTDPLTD
ncbi:unnamed protein product [Ambrosiozyma monospora]|uniref:Unnamed protein product n=1 Tax=Ambrosiozyma monospora TaxID=43982 RepID=A0ACB5UCU6_AMBMO|nr:unnamed protein product [Ambrosiozyma monospora]